MASVSLRGLTKMYTPPSPALDEVSLEIADGEFVALLGPSGCGKSTILRCLAGLEAATAGEILIGDRRVNDLPPGERDVAMVFQNYALYPHLTVRENLEFPLRMRRLAPRARAERVDAVSRRLEIGALLDRLPASLSGGQRQRVALGRAMVREPAVFLLDEPLSNLDAALRVQLRGELLALHAALRATMVYVTHDQVEALTMGQRLVLLDGGRVQQVGTPAQVYGRPVNTFVARFVGTPGMNLIAGDPQAPHLTLGIRPEHVTLVSPEAGDLHGEIEAVERLGSETLVHTRTRSGVVIARMPGLGDQRRGDVTGLMFNREQAHWFDAEGVRVGVA
jgi:ABC-type sugar transport system ATPase subunit